MRRRVFTMKGLSQSGHWPSGNPRYYLRRKGYKTVAMPDAPRDHRVFVRAYLENSEGDDFPAQRLSKGTIAHGVDAWLRSPDFATRAKSTQQVWKRFLDDISDRYGTALIRDLRTEHIEIDLSGRAPHPANNRLKVWRGLCRWWKQEKLHASNPAREVEKRKVLQTEGHEAWTLEDLEAFRARWPIGTQQRAACELIHYTGARIGDATRIGPGMVRDGWLRYVTEKTGETVTIPLHNPPPFAEAPLWEALRAIPRHAVFLTTERGKSRSSKAARQWFAKAADHLPGHKTAHGLRKLRLATMAERGATEAQLKAWVGHRSSSETDLYTRSAENKKVLGFPTHLQKLEK